MPLISELRGNAVNIDTQVHDGKIRKVLCLLKLNDILRDINLLVAIEDKTDRWDVPYDGWKSARTAFPNMIVKRMLMYCHVRQSHVTMHH